MACAASRGVKEIYSDDEDIARCAAQVSIRVIAQKELSVPSDTRQLRLPESE